MASIATKRAPSAPPSTPRPSSGSREVARRLAALMHGTAAAGEVLRRMEDSGLTLTQCKVLTALAPAGEEEAQGAKDVSGRIGASLPTVSRAVDALVRRGLVDRTEDEDDRRVRRLALTDEGQRLVRDLVAARMDGVEAFVASLTEAQRRKLSVAVDALLVRDEVATAYRQLGEDAR